MPQKSLSKQALLAKVKGKGPVADRKYAVRIKLKSLDGIVWRFIQAK